MNEFYQWWQWTCDSILAKILIAGGNWSTTQKDWALNRQDHHIEVIDLLNPKYKSDLLRAPLAGSVLMIGGVIKCCGQNWPFYSDGYYGVILGEQQFKRFEILDGHSEQSGVILNQEKLYINGRGKTSTLISLDHASAIKGPDLPFSIQGHSMIQVDENIIYMIGGWRKFEKYTLAVSKKTWIINLNNNFELLDGPLLNHGTHTFSPNITLSLHRSHLNKECTHPFEM